MRIVAGRHKGRTIVAPPGRIARPTADRAREAAFNILAHAAWGGIADRMVLDAFAGSGALGLEALSRGAAHACFIENNAAAIATLTANLAALGEQGRATVVRADASRPPRAGRPYDLVFLDPPYGANLAMPALTGLAAADWLASGAICVVELSARERLDTPDGFTLLAERVYGAARLIFLSKHLPD